MTRHQPTNQEVTPVTAQTHPPKTIITEARALRAPRWACGLGLLLLAAGLLAVGPHGQTHALNAAGAFKGEAIGGIANFVEKLKGNLVWLGGTAMGLVIAVVGIMFMAGHSRAHDIAIRTIAGLAILASISGIVA
jgi:hypothetical protein